MLHNVLTSIELLADASLSFCDHCAIGIEPNVKRIKDHLDNSLMLVTALSPHIGYEKAAKISLTAYQEDISLRETAVKLGFLTAEQFDSWVTHPLRGVLCVKRGSRHSRHAVRSDVNRMMLNYNPAVRRVTAGSHRVSARDGPLWYA